MVQHATHRDLIRTGGPHGDRAGDAARIAALAEAVAALERETADLARGRAAAEAANEAKTRYLVAVSHELRSPLNAIYGYAQLLERAGPDGATVGEAGAVIRRSAEHLTNLVEGLLEISRIESGVLTIRADVVDVRALLAQVTDMFAPQAAAKGLTLDLRVADRLPTHVRTDGKRLRQILINLVSNAVKYTRRGGVRIAVGYRSQVADIEVVDTGIGIPADELPHLFEPFRRGRSPEARAEPGIGLGLAITNVLARVMGGDLTAASVAGEGSCFRLRVLLPSLADGADAGDGRPRGRIIGYEGPRRAVLVIDDDPAQRAVLAAFLAPLGFAVRAAADGEAGLALAAADAADAVLLDVQMPGLDGWATAARLRAAHPATRILLVSANAHEFRAGGDGASDHDAFLTKPVDLDELLAAIGRQLGLRWIEAPAATAPPAAPAAATDAVPPEAAPFLDRLRRQARIGHVRALDEGLDELAAAVPAAAGLAAVLRGHAGRFDMRSFLATLDDAARI